MATITMNYPGHYAVVDHAAIKDGAEITFDNPDANASVFSLERMLRTHVDEWGRIPDSILQNAVRIVLMDGRCRRHGRRMHARFAGKDAATGQRFDAGTEIYYANGAAVIAERKLSNWSK